MGKTTKFVNLRAMKLLTKITVVLFFWLQAAFDKVLRAKEAARLRTQAFDAKRKKFKDGEPCKFIMLLDKKLQTRNYFKSERGGVMSDGTNILSHLTIYCEI